MERKKILIVLIAVIILIIALISIIAINEKEDSQIIITSQSTLKNNDLMTITLTDSSENPIANQKVEITITDSNEEEIKREITTNEMGIGSLELSNLTAGQYNITIKYDGNNQYRESEATQILTINNHSVEQKSETRSSEDNMISEDGYSYNPGYGPEYDSLGMSREEAAARGWHYIPHNIPEGDVGVYVPYDEEAGAYHL